MKALPNRLPRLAAAGHFRPLAIPGRSSPQIAVYPLTNHLVARPFFRRFSLHKLRSLDHQPGEAMKNRIHFLHTATLALALTTSLGTAAQSPEQAFLKAQESFELGLRGSEKDNEAAAEQFKQLSAAEPDNPLFSAYYGSTFTVKARYAWAENSGLSG